MSVKKSINIVLTFLLIFVFMSCILLLIAAILSSCNTTKQYQKFENKCIAAIPTDVPIQNAAIAFLLPKFPCDTLEKKGKTDTVTNIQHDTTYTQKKDTVIIHDIITRTLNRTDTFYDNRKIAALTAQLSQQNDTSKKYKDAYNAEQLKSANLNGQISQLNITASDNKKTITKKNWIIGVSWGGFALIIGLYVYLNIKKIL